MMTNTTADATIATNYLHTVESMIIERMARATGRNVIQMKSLIHRIPELKDYYHQVRSQVLAEMAA